MISLASKALEENRRRAYTITLIPSLFYGSCEEGNHFTLICEWGRTDTGLHQRRTYLFDTRNDALAKAQRVVKQRLVHGYEITRKGQLYNEMEDRGMLPETV